MLTEAIDQAKCSRTELLGMIQDIIRRNSNEPADEIIAMGRALIGIGEALKGKPAPEARAVLRAVQALN